MVNRAYTSQEIRNPHLREMVNLVCDAGEILDETRFLKPRDALDLAGRLSTFASSLAHLYAAKVELYVAHAILNGATPFEPRITIELRDTLRRYHHSPLAEEYAGRLDDLRYVVELSRDTVEGLTDFHPERVRSLMDELAPYVERSGEIQRLHGSLTARYACHATAPAENRPSA